MHDKIHYDPSKSVGGINGWYWVTTDSGAWFGPKDDWEQSHLPLIRHYIRNPHNTTVVQAGGNLGMYPKLLSKLFAKVYTFEPDPLNFFCLNQNCVEENIVKMQAALGAEYGKTCVMNRLTMSNVGMHKVVDNYDQNLAIIPMIRLDTFEFKNVSLLMLDLEGYEYNALSGAYQLIQDNRPIIFLERPDQRTVDLLVNLHDYRQVAESKMDVVFAPN